MPRFRILVLAGLAAGVAFAGTACGGADGDGPSISGIAVDCEDSGNDDIGQVVSAVAAEVQDPDRDLVGVEGRVNGIQITLTDDDADSRFTWSPPDSSEPLACAGDFVIQISASDNAGNTATKSRVVSK